MSRLRHDPRRDDTGRILLTREAIAVLGHRHPNHVRRLIPAVAYDVTAHWRHRPSPLCQACATTAAALLDLDDAERILGPLEHRDRGPRLQPLAS